MFLLSKITKEFFGLICYVFVIYLSFSLWRNQIEGLGGDDDIFVKLPLVFDFLMILSVVFAFLFKRPYKIMYIISSVLFGILLLLNYLLYIYASGLASAY